MEKVGLPSLVCAIAVSAVMLILTVCLFAAPGASGDVGLSLPSPNEWHIPKFIGWVLNSSLIFLSIAVITSANRQYNFIPSAGYALPALMPILVCSCCITTATISTSTILMATNIAALFILFGTYESYNASKEFFILATLFSVGSMFQYAFLMMIPVYIIGGIMMKSLRVRETVAFILGLIAPYWILVGLDIVPSPSLRMPDTLKVLSTARGDSDLFIALLGGIIMSIMGVVVAIYNSLRLLMRNARPRSMHATVNVMGFVSVLCMVLNFNNFVSYLGTIALWLAIETAMMFELYHTRSPRLWTAGISAVFIILFIIAL